MAINVELVLGVMCRDAQVDSVNGICLTEVYPVVAVQAKCDGRPPDRSLVVKLNTIMLVLVFRRKQGTQGHIYATAKGSLQAADKVVAEGLILDLSIPEGLDSTSQIINLEGTPVVCPSTEGMHVVDLTFILRDGENVVAEVSAPLHIAVTH